LALSTRFCLAPDRGVIVLLRKGGQGEAAGGVSRLLGVSLALVGRCWVRLAEGVVDAAREGFCGGLEEPEAILGIRGGLFAARAAAALSEGIWGRLPALLLAVAAVVEDRS
jgi:hypothetical protein